ncbi:UdgX family uracil-DNA binding protein [Rhodopila sp.]|uniref:UdgX family uracil-DNA binding protein n=1 Tax=Rhodopila sp. TaxID=2480087 RepID=UPI003D0D4327
MTDETDWQGWRRTARLLVLAGIEPAELTWSVGGRTDPLPDADGSFQLPRALVELASVAIQARQPDRFGLLYSLVWRAHHGEKLLDDDQDPDLSLARRMALAVRADAHRMRTLVRFMPVRDDAGQRFLGWFAPAHFVLPANAQLMARRFPDQLWSIATPDGSAHWDGTRLLFGSGPRQVEDDATLVAWWDAHRAQVLDSAVEGTSIPMAEALDEAPRPPNRAALGPVVVRFAPDPGLEGAAKEAWACERCSLYGPATQPVFGEGPAGATVMFLGEQPGDQEDTIGRPFVGPAGQMMDRAMEEAGIDRRTVYVTNAVKHFKFTPRGKRRIHQTPETPEIRACDFWLDVERVHVKPRLLVLMGATAARAVLRRAVTISRERGRPIPMEDGQTVFVTVHPSYLLRIPDAAAKAREYAAFVADLKTVRGLMEAG